MHDEDQPLPIIKKEPPRRSARCDDAPPPLLLEGIAQFNAGEYWECHETLETIWRVESDHIRYLYQGKDPNATDPYNLLPWRLGLLTQTNSNC